MPRLLCGIVEVFNIQGRGALAVLEDPEKWRIPRVERVYLREAVRVLRPDGSSVRTFIESADFMRRGGRTGPFAVMLPSDVPAAAVPVGSLLFLEREGEAPALWDGGGSEYSPPPSSPGARE